MKNYVVQVLYRYDFQAKSMKAAKKLFSESESSLKHEREEVTIVEQETGDEERLD